MKVTATPQPSAPAISTNYTQRVRNNALSLLHQLLDDEKNVSKLLIIKRESKELHTVITNISDSAGAMVKSLDAMAKADSSINFKNTDLPPGETAARAMESKASASELLHGKGADFEFALLLTQAEALKYGSNLAKVAASDEPDTKRRQQLAEMSRQLMRHYDDVIKLLRPKPSPAK